MESISTQLITKFILFKKNAYAGICVVGKGNRGKGNSELHVLSFYYGTTINFIIYHLHNNTVG